MKPILSFVLALLCSALVRGEPAASGASAPEPQPAVHEAWSLHFDNDWRVAGTMPEKALLISLQGLANRTAPRLYIIYARDYPWEITAPLWEFYQRRDGFHFTELHSADEALAKLGRYAKGYVVWDPAVAASLNVAFTLAGLDDAVVVSPELIPLVERHGLKELADLRGRFTGMTDARIYAQAYDRYWPRCDHDAVMLLGGAAGAVRQPGMADWGVRQRMFFHDLSANPENPAELALLKRILAGVNPLGTVFGWHSYAKDTEEQHTTLISSYGLKMEGLNTLPNLSFNCQVPFSPGFKFTNNSHVRPGEKLVAQKKVYISFVQSDSIGIGVWTKPGRGQLPFAWQVTMSWLNFSPAALEYFRESATPNDYFIGGLSGPGYMYPNSIPADKFPALMAQARALMATLDLHVMEIMDNTRAIGNVGDTNLTKETVDRYYAAFPHVIGFINGYGPSRTYDLRDGRPLISYDYYIDPSRPRDEVAADLDELIELNVKRPYFLLVHVRESNDVNSLIAMVKQLEGHPEVVPLDVFLKLAASDQTYVTRYREPGDERDY